MTLPYTRPESLGSLLTLMLPRLLASLLLLTLTVTARAADAPSTPVFKIVARESAGSNDHLEWLASSGEARFIIALDLHSLTNGDARAISKCGLRHVPASKPQAFLKELAASLALSGDSRALRHTDSLDLSAVILGTQMSRSGSSFSGTPSGDWIVAKVFLPNAEGEVFLSLNPVAGTGDFTVQNPGSREPLVRELASVL